MSGSFLRLEKDLLRAVIEVVEQGNTRQQYD